MKYFIQKGKHHTVLITNVLTVYVANSFTTYNLYNYIS